MMKSRKEVEEKQIGRRPGDVHHESGQAEKFYADFIGENKSDQGQLFKATKKLLGKKEELSFPDHVEKVSLANDIGRFF